MSIARALAVLGAGMQGLSQGEETNRQRRRQEEDDAFRKEQRDRTRTQWQRDDEAYNEAQADKAAERQAMAPTVVQPDLAPDQMGPAGFNAGGKTFANPDQAQAAATTYNAPASGMRRAAAAVRNPTRAADLQARADQAELGAINLDATKQAQQAKAWEDKMTSAIMSPDPAIGAKFLSDSGADGLDGKTKWIGKIEGDNVHFALVDQNGNPTGISFVKPNTPAGRLELVAQLSRATPITAKLADLRAQQKATADAEDKKADNARLDRTLAETTRHNKAVEGIQRDAANARAAGGAGGAGAADAAPVWDDKASTFLRQKFTITDPTTGATAVDGAGLQFGKAMSLAFARRNGGDLDSAIGGAFDIDARLRAAATDPKGGYDAGKHNALRAQALQSLSAPRAQQTASPMDAARQDMRANGTQSAEVNIGGQRGTLDAAGNFTPAQRVSNVPQPRAGMAAAAAPAEAVIGKPPTTFNAVPEMEQALAKEMLEMAEGKRMKFSTPELAAYGKARKAAADAAQQPGGMSELQRAQLLSRQQLGKV